MESVQSERIVVNGTDDVAFRRCCHARLEFESEKRHAECWLSLSLSSENENLLKNHVIFFLEIFSTDKQNENLLTKHNF